MIDFFSELTELKPELPKNADVLVDSKKKRGRKKIDGNGLVKALGLFDHIKHIRTIQDPDYYKNLTELDKKSFNHFMILKALSMNSNILDEISALFKLFDIIPSPQFYTLIIKIIPTETRYYPWIKSTKNKCSKELTELLVKYYEISKAEANEYARILNETEKGKKELEQLCQDFGLEKKEIELALKEGSNNNEE